MIEVVDAGLLTTVQDRGRAGWAHIGVPRSGAVDPALAAVVNRLVGNDGGAPSLETVGGLAIRAVTPVTIASDVEPVARTLGAGEIARVPSGGRPWHYLAVRGGIAVEPVLDSCSTDTLSGLGPAALQAGDRLAVAPEPRSAPHGETVPTRHGEPRARLLPGPRADWFDGDVVRSMAHVAWRVTSSSRVGVRLSGGSLRRTVDAELPSEGLVRGAIQVPPDGDPIMMLADHPTTGGYPVVAVVHPDDVAAVAQAAAGDTVRFTVAS